ncbi:hypothetical protein AAVH_42520 [Aphelenchoides avenae]|nr:hypothetical protein AAVH_42520 [Aphelenchus avenae]
MLAAPAERNFSIDTLRIWAGEELDEGELSDYRSMDAMFGGGMHLGSLELSLFENKNAVTGDLLTDCVGYERSDNSHRYVLHIVKAEVDPDSLFAAE